MKKATKKAFWFVCGIVSLTLGIAGAILPLLPTTPFILLAAFAFSQSSQKLHDWIIDHGHFGPLVKNWRKNGAIHQRSKRIALAVIVATPVITWLIGAPIWALLVQIGVLAVVATFILTRPDGEIPEKH